MSELEDDPSLRASLREAMAHASAQGAGEAYISPLAIFLHASLFQLSVLASLPPLLGAFAQAAGVWIVEKGTSRKQISLVGIVINALCWLPIALLPLLFEKGEAATDLLIAIVVLYHTSAGLIAPVWGSLLGEIVPAELRGTFLGKRNSLVSASMFLSLFAGGQMLGYFEQVGIAAWGFFLLFCCAGVARGISALYFSKYRDIPFVTEAEHRFSFHQFLRRAPFSNFGRFVLFCSFIGGAVAFSAPFFAAYMLRELHFTLAEYGIATAASAIASFLTMQHWGKISDQVGNKKILNISGFAVCAVPLLWLISSNFLFIILIQMFSGFIWAGYNLAAANFLFDAVSKPKVPRLAAYHALASSILVLAFSLFGGWMASHLERGIVLFGGDWRPRSPYLVIFTISAAMRLLTAFIFLPRFREVRQVPVIRHREVVVRIADLRPVAGNIFDVIATFRSGNGKK